MYLSTFIAKFFLLFFGLVGNILGILVFSRRSIENKIKTKIIYQAILTINSLYLLSQVIQDSLDSFEIRLHRLSIIACKLRGYWNFAVATITTWYLVYITIERFVSIKFPHIKFLQRKSFQRLIIIIVIVYDLAVYTPWPIFYEMFTLTTINTDLNVTRIRTLCRIKDSDVISILATFDAINAVCVPFILITISSCLLIYTVLAARFKTLSRMQSQASRRNLMKDIRLSLSILALNCTILLAVPLNIANYFVADIDTFLYDIFCCIFYTYYCLDSFVLVLLNSNFKKELLLMLNLKT